MDREMLLALSFALSAPVGAVARPRPESSRLAVDDDQMNIAMGHRIGPPHFEPALGIVGKQYRSRDFAAVIGLHIGERDVF